VFENLSASAPASCQSDRNPFIVAQATVLTLVRDSHATTYPPPKICLKNRPTARKGFFEDFAGAGVVCAVVFAAALFASAASDEAFIAAKVSPPSPEFNAAVTCVCVAPAEAGGTVAGASPALTAAGKGCCSAAVFFAALPPGELTSASATDIVCSGGHPHAELS
jgi:hypothetical protein